MSELSENESVEVVTSDEEEGSEIDYEQLYQDVKNGLIKMDKIEGMIRTDTKKGKKRKKGAKKRIKMLKTTNKMFSTKVLEKEVEKQGFEQHIGQEFVDIQWDEVEKTKDPEIFQKFLQKGKQV